MGYHIIIPDDKKGIKSHYVSELEELAFLDDLTPETIIYQGEEHWTPAQLSSSNEYSNYTKDWFCAGIRAQALFKKLAINNDLIVEDISQDQENFKQYTQIASNSIKRGDFLIRNARNIEIEVKCRTLNRKSDAAQTPYFKIGYGETMRLDSMQRLTGIPIIVAFFERDGKNPLPDSLRMIPVSEIITRNKKRQEVWYEEEHKNLCIPLALMADGFGPLDAIRALIDANNERGGSWSSIERESRELAARDILINAQKKLCATQGMPFFLPEDGICFKCQSDLIQVYGIRLATDFVTGCPHCHKSFCE